MLPEMATPLNVLFLMEDLCFGGTQKQSMALASLLDSSLFSPSVLTLTGPTDLDRSLPAHIPLHHLGTSRKLAPFFFARLGAKLRQLNPDILVTCTALPNIWGRLWGSFQHIPVIVGTCRGGGAPRRQHEWLLWRLASHIVCNSAPLIEVMRGKGVPETHLTLINNGVDTSHFTPGKNPDANLIVCVARLARDKDHPTLLRAFALLAASYPELRLRLVGEGPEEENLRKMAASLLPKDALRRLEFAGASADPVPHYQEAAIFALSSIREAQPNVLLEAMSAGLPICATSVGGIPHLAHPGENGFLCEPGDYHALAKNIAQLLDKPELRRQFGQKSRERAQRDFSFDSMVQAHQNLFLRLWQKAKARE